MRDLAGRVERLSLGMTKAEVLTLLGRPTSDSQLASKETRPPRVFGSSLYYVGDKSVTLPRLPAQEDLLKAGEATIELFFDKGDRLVWVASNIQGVGVDAAADAATMTNENKAAGMDGAGIVNLIVAAADLHDNKTVPLIGADLLAEARLEVRAEVDAVPVVVLGTFLETVSCAIPPQGEQGAFRIDANAVRVDTVLKGSVPGGEIYIDTAVMASQPESYVFRYYVNFKKGKQYFFFLTERRGRMRSHSLLQVHERPVEGTVVMPSSRASRGFAQGRAQSHGSSGSETLRARVSSARTRIRAIPVAGTEPRESAAE
jgi:hypothetical protein